MPCVMIVDDEPAQRNQLEEIATKLGHTCITLADGQDAIDYLMWNKSPSPDVILLDLFMPGTAGITVIRALQNTHPNLPIIVLSLHGTTRHSVQAVKAGAYDYIPKPASLERLQVTIDNALVTRRMKREIEQLKPTPFLSLNPASYSGFSEKWMHVIARAAETAQRDDTLMIEGETGIGKLTLARAIHKHSSRADKPFVVADTAQDLESLNSVLVNTRGGTLAVHHTGRMPMAFLRGLERLYYSMTEQNIRLILCKQSSIRTEAEEAVERFFNKDNSNTIIIPSLRERRQDIPLLATNFLRKAAAIQGRSECTLTETAKTALMSYCWPGNILQLQAELFAALLQSGETLETPDCCNHSENDGNSSYNIAEATDNTPMIPLVNEDGNLRSLEEIEGEIIRFALHHCNTSRSDIARMLGIGRTTLYRKAHLLPAA